MISKAAQQMGKKGGPARAKALTAKRRHEIAVKAGQASAKARKKKSKEKK